MNLAAKLMLDLGAQVSLSMILCTIAASIGLTVLLYVTTMNDLPDREGF